MKKQKKSVRPLTVQQEEILGHCVNASKALERIIDVMSGLDWSVNREIFYPIDDITFALWSIQRCVTRVNDINNLNNETDVRKD